MIYEFKKINQNQIITIISVFSILLSIVLPLFFIHGYETYDYSSGKEKSIQGFEGLRFQKNQVEKISGELSQTDIQEVLRYINAFSTDQDLDYIKTEQKYPGMYYFLTNAYAPYGEESSFSVRNINPNKTLNEAHRNKVNTKMYRFGDSYLPKKKELKLFDFLDENETVMKYGFVDQWPIIIKSFIFTYGFLVLVAIIMASRLFSIEKNTKMDKIIEQRNIRIKEVITVNKLKMFYGYLLLLFLLCTCIILGIVLIPIGIYGLESQIQVIPDLFSSIYFWSIKELMFKYIIGAFLSISAIGGFSIFVNHHSNSDLTTIMGGICFSIFPIILKSSFMTSYSLSKWLEIFPIHGIHVLGYINDLTLFSLGGKILLPYYIICISSILLLIVLNYIILRKSKMI